MLTMITNSWRAEHHVLNREGTAALCRKNLTPYEWPTYGPDGKYIGTTTAISEVAGETSARLRDRHRVTCLACTRKLEKILVAAYPEAHHLYGDVLNRKALSERAARKAAASHMESAPDEQSPSYLIKNMRTDTIYRILGTGPTENAPHITAVWVQKVGTQGAVRWSAGEMVSNWHDLVAVDSEGNPQSAKFDTQITDARTGEIWTTTGTAYATDGKTAVGVWVLPYVGPDGVHWARGDGYSIKYFARVALMSDRHDLRAYPEQPAPPTPATLPASADHDRCGTCGHARWRHHADERGRVVCTEYSNCACQGVFVECGSTPLADFGRDFPNVEKVLTEPRRPRPNPMAFPQRTAPGTFNITLPKVSEREPIRDYLIRYVVVAEVDGQGEPCHYCNDQAVSCNIYITPMDSDSDTYAQSCWKCALEVVDLVLDTDPAHVVTIETAAGA